jgi:outer membrane protein assembly factor BamD
MAAPRIELRKSSAGAGRSWVGRQSRLAMALIGLAIPLSGCGTGSLWDKFFAKDDTFVEEHADKLYNEGLFLMNDRRRRRRNSRKSTASIPIPTGRANRC